MKKFLLYIILLALGAFLWWAFSPLLFDTKIQDELDPTLQARLEAQRRVDEARETALPRNPNASDENNINEPELESTADSSADSSTPIDLPEVFIDGPFSITGTAGHPASGNLEIIYSPEETLIRYQDYDGTNGPDLKIYLAKDLEASEYLSLGDARGNQGTIIYGVPMDVDLDDYKYVLTWCEAFGVLFDYAEIN